MIDVKSHYRTSEWDGWHSNYSVGIVDVHISDRSSVILTDCRPLFGCRLLPGFYHARAASFHTLCISLFFDVPRFLCDELSNVDVELYHSCFMFGWSMFHALSRRPTILCEVYRTFEKAKVRFTIEQAVKVQRGRRGIALHFL